MVVSAVAENHIVSRISIDGISAVAASDDIVAIAATDEVGSTADEYGIVAAAGINVVVAAFAVNMVYAVCAFDAVAACRACNIGNADGFEAGGFVGVIIILIGNIAEFLTGNGGNFFRMINGGRGRNRRISDDVVAG